MASSPGLRERKKQKTRWAIQEHALRLIAEQGYEATTVDQIAAAAEISPSTFFRYFKTKEDVILEDEYDPVMAEAFLAAPPELAPIPALRHGLRTAMAAISDEEMAKVIERGRLQLAEPALRARAIESLVGTGGMLQGAFAERTGRSPDDPALRVTVGAVLGVMLAAILDWFESGAESRSLLDVMDDALGHLEAGLPL